MLCGLQKKASKCKKCSILQKQKSAENKAINSTSSVQSNSNGAVSAMGGGW